MCGLNLLPMNKSNIKGKRTESLLFDGHDARVSVWPQRFTASAILQGSIIILLTALGIVIQMIYSSTINIIQFLSLSFEGPAKWIFLGFIFYMVLIALKATTATFYNHLEVNLQKRIRGIRSALAWINFIGVNIGAAALAITLIYAGLAGSGILDVIISGSSTNLKENTAVMTEFIAPIAVFAVILITGALAGSIVYFATYFQNP
jgi:hypothetical protein